MQFNTLNTGKKRQMVLLPEVNPNSLLLFYENGNSGCSWSLRDYSVPQRVREHYAREFGWSASEVRKKARFQSDAPTVDTKKLDFWYEYTRSGNALVLEQANAPTAPMPAAEPLLATTKPEQAMAPFPILNLEVLRGLPKASKRMDMERILHSSNSEDWVTWNLVNLICLLRPLDWWQAIVSAACAANNQLKLAVEPTDRAQLEFWRRVSAPAAYERASRMRMRQSQQPAVAARSLDAKPVEGNSEIDVVLNTKRHLIFIEAKLGSDVNMCTTYDPSRNQIVRNIDCLLENASDREPFFWMFVRDSGPGRAYYQLISEYKKNPAQLARELPHRESATVSKIAERLTLIRWQDLAGSLLAITEEDTPETRAVKEELKRRVMLG